jgi:hypothetical protein
VRTVNIVCPPVYQLEEREKVSVSAAAHRGEERAASLGGQLLLTRSIGGLWCYSSSFKPFSIGFDTRLPVRTSGEVGQAGRWAGGQAASAVSLDGVEVGETGFQLPNPFLCQFFEQVLKGFQNMSENKDTCA